MAVVKVNGVEGFKGRSASFKLDKKFRNFPCLTITEPDVDGEATGEKEVYAARVLSQYRKLLEDGCKSHIGYPLNLGAYVDYSALSDSQFFSINNAGDPFIESNLKIHSRQFEVGVLDWFASLWEIERDDYWGYVSNSGTEGNFHGILLGRETHPDGVFYASNASHYSVFKVAMICRMEMVKVDTLFSGEIDCNDLKRKLIPNRPAILAVNIGTTMKGAVDDLDLVLKTLEDSGFTKDRFYIHCDAALSGLMLPFMKKGRAKLSFKKPISSISVSGHKFLGCPMPCGVQITRKELISAFSKNVEYLATRDATIMGSRNGHSPIFLWYALSLKGHQGLQKDVERCLQNAKYLKERLRGAGFGVMLNELSNTVVFERPQDECFVLEWQLACQGKIAHAVAMPNVTLDKIDQFVQAFIDSRRACFPDGRVEALCISEDVGPEHCACSRYFTIESTLPTITTRGPSMIEVACS